MFLLLGLWLLIGFGLIWVMLDPLGRVTRIVWEILVPLFYPEPVDLRAKFGEWAVVTGSTDGIGKAYAKELAARRMNLVLISRNLERLENTRDEILREYPGVEVRLIVADFAKSRDVFRDIEAKLKDIPVGILVNNVGTMYDYPMYVGEVTEEKLWEIIDVNIGATTLMTRLVINDMQRRGRGAIVNVSSGSEMQPLPLMTVYAATKVYVHSFTEALRAEYGRHGITVQKLAPLFVNTKINAFSHKLQVSSVFVPSATTYAKNAINTLGKLDSSTGYWAHGIQTFFSIITPVWIRTKVGQLLNESFREDYFNDKKS